MFIIINNNYVPEEDQLIVLCNGGAVFLWGRHWIFYYYVSEIQTLKAEAFFFKNKHFNYPWEVASLPSGASPGGG